MKGESVAVGGFVFYIGLLILGAIGWVLNLVEIAQTWAWPPDGVMVLRIIGIFVAPIGAVMGWV